MNCQKKTMNKILKRKKNKRRSQNLSKILMNWTKKISFAFPKP